MQIIVLTDIVGRGLDHSWVHHAILFEFLPLSRRLRPPSGPEGTGRTIWACDEPGDGKEDALARAMEKAARARIDTLAPEMLGTKTQVALKRAFDEEDYVMIHDIILLLIKSATCVHPLMKTHDS